MEVYFFTAACSNTTKEQVLPNKLDVQAIQALLDKVLVIIPGAIN